MTTFAVIALAACIILQAADVWTTNRVLAQGGSEANPVMRWAQRNLGSAWWLALKVVPVFIVVALAWRFGGAVGVLGVCIGSAAWTAYGVWHNMGEIEEGKNGK